MNCAQCQELLVAGLEGLLLEAPKQALTEHLKACPACRAQLKGVQGLRQRLVANGKALGQSSLEDEVMNRILREQSARLKSAAGAGMGPQPGTSDTVDSSMSLREAQRRSNLNPRGERLLHGPRKDMRAVFAFILLDIPRRLTMKSSMARLAVAAAVVLAVLGGIFLWSGTKSGVALADVLSKVEQVQAFMYKMTMHMKGSMEGMPPGGVDMEATAWIANDYGMKMEMTSADPKLGQAMTQQMYILPQQKMIMMLMPSVKQYTRMQGDDEMFEKQRRQNNDPRLMLKKILECQYTDLGKTTLDGMEVQGFQTTDPAYAGNGLGDVDIKVWVDRKTELPVRMDMKVKMGEQTEMEAILHDFQWDVPVSPAEFNPVIPPDYTASVVDGMKMPTMNEETALAGLKLCRELNGSYPDDLNLMTLIQSAMKSFKESHAFDDLKHREPNATAMTPEEQKKLMEDIQKKMMDKMMPIQALGGFHMKLVQEKKEPAYYGKIVTPGDIAQVLLRWKTGENEYRVIFADLHAETVNADTLAKLEAGLPK